MRKPRSYLVTALLAGATLYYAQSLSRDGRTWIDWTVLTLISVAFAWNLVRLGERLHRAGGTRDVWHLARTAWFWIVGLFNTVLIRPEDVGTWKNWLGWALLAGAVLDSIALHRKERAAMSRSAANTQPRASRA